MASPKRTLLHRLQHGCSHFVGWLADRRVPVALRPGLYRAFSRFTGVNVEEARPPLDSYPSLGASSPLNSIGSSGLDGIMADRPANSIGSSGLDGIMADRPAGTIWWIMMDGPTSLVGMPAPQTLALPAVSDGLRYTSRGSLGLRSGSSSFGAPSLSLFMGMPWSLNPDNKYPE